MTTLDALRDALTAARPGMTREQRDATDALLAALTPRMAEPKWPGALVMAGCTGDGVQRTHARRNDPYAGWECTYNCQSAQWEDLIGPRPLTAEERAEYGIPGECERPHAEPITNELVERCIEASVPRLGVGDRGTFMYPAWVRAVLRAAGHPTVPEGWAE